MKTKTKKRLILLLLLFILGAVTGVVLIQFEGKKPELVLDDVVRSVGIQRTLSGHVSDQGKGIRRIWIALIRDKTETVLFEETLPSAGFIRGGMVFDKEVSLDVNPTALGISDGPATLRIAVWDYSWRNWLKGNTLYSEFPITIDTRPPSISILSRQHNINQGGAAVVVYRVTDDTVDTGVKVGDNRYDGYSGYFKDPSVYLAFFALSHTQGKNTPLWVEAVDAAGNTAKTGFPCYIRNRKFKTDRIPLSDRFLKMKMLEFQGDPDVAGQASALEQFLMVNRKLRKANSETLRAACSSPVQKKQWDGAFLRLPRSATRANFADHRSYMYNNKVVDQQYHMGIDLASVAQSPIPAANAGTVCMVGPVGIYGIVVMIDHGFGIFSQYAHMSRADVAPGDVVEKGTIIGRTGATGLAGGDHLHFGMMVGETFVNPVEWWDSSWIENNIERKLRKVEASL
ncbi:MAG: peptidase M23 [Deltaproteobacteria bacterium]|nr:MAG: peptidase M23 [Deltaproteobacteria bacterium]